MLQIQTKLTSQGQVSVPAAVRNLLGVTPGASLEWTHENGRVTVKRAARNTTAQIHAVLFPDAMPGIEPAKTHSELKQGIRQHMLRQHAGR